MRILVLSSEFPPVGGGAGQVAEDICRILAARGHHILVQTAHVKGLAHFERRANYDIRRVTSLRRCAHDYSVPGLLAFTLLNALPALHLVRAWRPQVLHVHCAVPTGAIGWFVHRLTGAPYVITAHLGDVPGGLPDRTRYIFPLIKPMTVPIWRRAAAATAVSDFVRALAERAYGVKVQTIANGVEISSSDPFPNAVHDPLRLVFAGRFHRQKNLVFLINVLAHVTDLSWHLDMLGDGPTLAEVQARIQQIGLGERIRLHGWVPPERVEAVMRCADILVLPSLYEGMPVVGLRALRYGLAILSSQIDGVVDLVCHGENGYLCPVNDSVAFAAALRAMLTNPGHLLAMRQASRQRAARFDLQHSVDQYEQVLQAVVR